MKKQFLPLSSSMAETVARRFRALGEPQRLRILQVLEASPRNVNEVVRALGASQPNVSRHLQALFEAGLVSRRRAGTSTVYSISDSMVFKLCGLVCEGAIKQARSRLEELEVAGGGLPPRGSKR